MEITKICLHCQKTFSILDNRAKIKKFCSKQCREKKWSIDNRKELNEKVRAYRARRYQKEGRWRDEGPKARSLKAWMIQLKSNPCTDCKGIFPVCCMDFDHKKGTIKSYNLGSMFAHHYSRELIESELAKCELVCSNCHRIRTRDRRINSGKHKST